VGQQFKMSAMLGYDVWDTYLLSLHYLSCLVKPFDCVIMTNRTIRRYRIHLLLDQIGGSTLRTDFLTTGIRLVDL